MYTYTHLEDFILKVYRKLSINSPDQLNPYLIADALNIGIYPISTESQSIQFEGKYYIFLNHSLTASERFEVFGHELGHVLLHTGDQRRMNADYHSYQEWKANLFASHFCVPTFMLQKLSNNDLDKYSVSEMFGVTVNFADRRLDRYHTKIMYNKSFHQQSLVKEKHL